MPTNTIYMENFMKILNLPNTLTLARIVLIPVLCILYYIGFPGWNYWAAAIFIIASLTDLFDGMAARKMGLVSNFGKFMDPIADKLLVMASLLIIQEWRNMPSYINIVLIGREFIISGFRQVAADRGVVIAAGKTGKWKTAVQMTGISIIFLDNILFNLIGIPMGEILLYASVVLSIISCVEYIKNNINVIKE